MCSDKNIREFLSLKNKHLQLFSTDSSLMVFGHGNPFSFGLILMKTESSQECRRYLKYGYVLLFKEKRLR